MITILRRLCTKDCLRMINILHRSSENRYRMSNILRRSLAHDRLRIVIILHRSSQNRCTIHFFIFLVKATFIIQLLKNIFINIRNPYIPLSMPIPHEPLTVNIAVTNFKNFHGNVIIYS